MGEINTSNKLNSHMAKAGNQTWSIAVRGEWLNHYAIHATLTLRHIRHNFNSQELLQLEAFVSWTLSMILPRNELL